MSVASGSERRGSAAGSSDGIAAPTVPLQCRASAAVVLTAVAYATSVSSSKQVLVQVGETASIRRADCRRTQHGARQGLYVHASRITSRNDCTRRGHERVVDRHRLETHAHVALQAPIDRKEIVDGVPSDVVARAATQRETYEPTPRRVDARSAAVNATQLASRSFA